MWTFANNGESSGLAQIFKDSSPFDDGGELEVIEGHPESANIPFMLDAPQEFASGLDTDLRKLTQQLKGK
jgi:Mn-containing catalase